MLASLKYHKWREEEEFQTIKRLDNSEEDRDHQITITTTTSPFFYVSCFNVRIFQWNGNDVKKRFISNRKISFVIIDYGNGAEVRVNKDTTS